MDANTLILNIVYIIRDLLIPITVSLAILVFMWGLLKYVISRDDESRKESRAIIVNGIIIIFVMVSVWGIVLLFIELFGIDLYSSNILYNKPILPVNLIVR